MDSDFSGSLSGRQRIVSDCGQGRLWSSVSFVIVKKMVEGIEDERICMVPRQVGHEDLEVTRPHSKSD